MRPRFAAFCLPVILLVVIGLNGQESKQMAITFDDLPFGYGGRLTLAEQRDAVARVLAVLGKHRIRATMFAIGRAITPANRNLIDAVTAAGHEVGNHSFSHRDLGAMTAADYIRDVERGEDSIRPWLKGAHYFRYPFLRQGDTADKRDAVLDALASRRIVVAPVTIDNNDYLYNQQLVDAKAEGRAVDLRDAYLNHMSASAAFYDAKARERIGRPVKQILLLHMNYLNSLYLDDLLERFRAEGWSFISFTEALSDDVYRWKYAYAGRQGAGHLDAIAPQ
jgi:peptidoglycan-N-acetylglucosamine deacetylase